MDRNPKMIMPRLGCGVVMLVARRMNRLSVEMLSGICTMRSSNSHPDPGLGGSINSDSGSIKYSPSPGVISVFDGMFEPVGESVLVATAEPLMVKIGDW